MGESHRSDMPFMGLAELDLTNSHLPSLADVQLEQSLTVGDLIRVWCVLAPALLAQQPQQSTRSFGRCSP